VRIKSIVQIQNCVDSTQFGESVTPAFDYRPKPVLLHVGQYIGRKGLDELLESAARLRARGLEFTLVLIGRGPEEARLKERAASLGLRNVHFLPPRPSTEMPSVYRSADALIFPTKEDIWGLVVNEAILCGVPVLSSTHGGATQEIAPRENWFDPNDPEAFDVGMARAIEGKLKHANPRSLLTPGQVAERIFDDVARICALSTRSTPQ
jgi:glycosyltransferase involved in cell wall biosynthesis